MQIYSFTLLSLIRIHTLLSYRIYIAFTNIKVVFFTDFSMNSTWSKVRQNMIFFLLIFCKLMSAEMYIISGSDLNDNL